jgi:Ca2+-binding RTX toxin-like protein
VQGDDGDDIFAPGPGDDTVDGGEGVDAVDFFSSHPFEPGMDGPVSVDLGTQSATGQGTDVLGSIEQAAGTLLDDTLVGSDVDNVLVGDEGSDNISGEGGDDLLDGDIFFFGFEENLPGSDSLDGGPGDDTCLGGETNVNCEQLEGPLGQVGARKAGALKRGNSFREMLLHRRLM